MKNDLFWLAEKSGTDLAPKDEKKVILLMRENSEHCANFPTRSCLYRVGYLLVPGLKRFKLSPVPVSPKVLQNRKIQGKKSKAKLSPNTTKDFKTSHA